MIKDETHMLHFFNFVWGQIHGQQQDEDSSHLKVFRLLKFKMKLGYECWRRECSLQDLVSQAIVQTIEETRALSIASLQRHM